MAVLLLWPILMSSVLAQEEEIDFTTALNVDFIKTNGLTLLPGHVVNIAKNGSDIEVDVNTNCNIYSGLFTEKSRQSHEFKFQRNSIRFNNANSSAENYFSYDNSINFFERQANEPYLPQASDNVVGVANTTITYRAFIQMTFSNIFVTFFVVTGTCPACVTQMISSFIF